QLFEILNANVILLGHLTKDLHGLYLARAQWLEYPEDRRSPVVQVEAKSWEELVSSLSEKLLKLLSPEGRILGFDAISKVQALDKNQVTSKFYEKWWFWTLVGVGVAGLGTGAYFVLKP